MKKTFIENFEKELFEELLEGESEYTIWIRNSDKRFEKQNILEEDALNEIIKIIKFLSKEEKENLELGWTDSDGEVLVSVYAKEEDMVDPSERILHNWKFAADQISQALGLFDEDEDKVYSSSFEITVEGTNKTLERKGIEDEKALEEILSFINNLSPEEKNNVALFWMWDETPGDGQGDVVVSVYGPSEIEEGEERTLSNWREAEEAIINALKVKNEGIKKELKEPVYLEDSTTFIVGVENSDLYLERKGVKSENALREILDFIGELSLDERKDVYLDWRDDEAEPGDCEGDLVVVIDEPSRREANYGYDDIIHNWESAKHQICRLLGIKRK